MGVRKVILQDIICPSRHSFRRIWSLPAQRFTKNTFNPLTLTRTLVSPFTEISILFLKDSKEPILGYVPKNDEKKNSIHKGLNYGTFLEICDELLVTNFNFLRFLKRFFQINFCSQVHNI